MPSTFFVFAYNFAPDGTCTAARPMKRYNSWVSAHFAALSLRRWYDVVQVA